MYRGRDGTGWMITSDCNGRTLTFGWLAATCGNCKPQVSPQRLSLVREVRYDPRIYQLVSSPLPELAKLHGSTLASRSSLALKPGQRDVLVPVTTLAARSMDVQANLSLAGGSGAVDLRIAVLSPTDPAQVGQGAVIDVNVTAKAADGSRNGSMYVWTDAYPRGSGTGGANFTARFAVLPGETRVDIRALVDFSSVE